MFLNAKDLGATKLKNQGLLNGSLNVAGREALGHYLLVIWLRKEGMFFVLKVSHLFHGALINVQEKPDGKFFWGVLLLE